MTFVGTKRSDAPPEPEAAGEVAFYIPARGPSSRPRRTLKHNDMFAVLDSHGDIGASPGGADGLFHSDTRVLSHLELLLDGVQPLLLGSNVEDDNISLYVDLTNPDIFAGERIVLLKNTIHVGRTIFARDGILRERLTVINHGSSEVRTTLSLAFDSDFADVFEVRGMHRKRRGSLRKKLLGTNGVALLYEGLDGTLRETTVSFEPAPTELGYERAAFALVLAPGEACTIFASVSVRGAQRPVATFFSGLVGARREVKAVTADIATVETSNDILNEVLRRSLADLYMLMTATPEGPYPYAGIPWYSTTFGRDGVIAALQMLWFDPRIAVGVLRRLARHQAAALDPQRDAQPGKILHEMRGGEMAALNEIPFGLYYGSVDSTPLFLMLAGLYAERTGDDALIGELWPNIERALEWIDRSGDIDGDGFVEYQRASERGLLNQGWKDSADAVFHSDGRLAEGPIALVEVQGYVFAAKQLMAAAARRLGMEKRAAQLAGEAQALQARFEEAFWCEDIGTYALALDGNKAKCRVRTSNPGHALFSGIVRTDRAKRLARLLLHPRFQSGWGIRTVAEGEARYNPMSYHNGSVWPHDNALIAAGFARYGLVEGIEPIFQRLIEAATYMDQRRLPELFCGFRRRPGRGPTLYPVACSPQAWAAGAPFMVLEALLGLRFEPRASRIVLRNPRVPAFVGDVTIRNLRLDDGRADFRIRREGPERVSVQVLGITGNVKVSLEFDPT
ncbi:MAG TPA: amylo-alpha-1,6-glucosidase [Hyphomicrobiaceae bacterium]|nr:amylo-alpha-1,6-glucosidase [Hyphomicrobiaceae bacterium]